MKQVQRTFTTVESIIGKTLKGRQMLVIFFLDFLCLCLCINRSRIQLYQTLILWTTFQFKIWREKINWLKKNQPEGLIVIAAWRAAPRRKTRGKKTCRIVPLRKESLMRARHVHDLNCNMAAMHWTTRWMQRKLQMAFFLHCLDLLSNFRSSEKKKEFFVL